MAFAVIMPKAGMSMETGRVVRWLKNVGDPVNAGEALLEIETDKVTMEVEAEVSGVLLQILADPGEEVPVTQIIGYVGERGEQAEKPTGGTPTPGTVQPADAPRDSWAPAAPLLREQGARQRVPATPLARTLARESGIDLALVRASGARGEIKARDILDASARRDAGVKPLASKGAEPASASFLTLIAEADVTDLVALTARVNEGLGVETSIIDWLIRAVALAVRDCPAVHGRQEGEACVVPDQVNIALSDVAGESLRVPVIRDAGSLSVRAISQQRRDRAEKARTGLPVPDDRADATFIVTSLEHDDIVAFTPLVSLSKGAALGAGCVRSSLVLSEGEVVARKVMYLSLTLDHRVIDGNQGAQFLTMLRTYLANPVALLA
jgi:pyruvate dehydrogenase E2 component (dihydrolipoyllysine-residue acetyltransferase)